MRKLVSYKCDFCGKVFASFEECRVHEIRHHIAKKANKMWKNHFSLDAINKQFQLWNKVPDNIKDITNRTRFLIQVGADSENPADTKYYNVHVVEINIYHEILLKGFEIDKNACRVNTENQGVYGSKDNNFGCKVTLEELSEICEEI